MLDFINGTPNPVLDLFQDALACRGLPPLSRRYQSVGVEQAFANVRPCQLNSSQEIFGLFESGWVFLQEMAKNPRGLWANLSEPEIERITNDLTEKSIRTRMIMEGWNAALNP